MASVPGATEERDARVRVGAEPPEKGPCHDPLLLSAPHSAETIKPLTQGWQASTAQLPPSNMAPLEYSSHCTRQCLSTDHCQHSICQVTLSTDSPKYFCHGETVHRAPQYSIRDPVQRFHTACHLTWASLNLSPGVSGHHHSHADLSHSACDPAPSSALSRTGDTKPRA